MDREFKKKWLIRLIEQSDLPKSKLDTLSMSWEPVDLDKVADFLLDNGVDIVNPLHLFFNKKRIL